MTQAEGQKVNGALLFSGLAAAFFWVGWTGGQVPRSLVFAILGGLAIAAPLLLFAGRIAPAMLNITGVLLTLVPVATVAGVFALAEDAGTLLGSLQLWPLILAALSASFGLELLGQSLLRRAFTLGVFGFVIIVSVLSLAGLDGMIDRWVLRTPIHLCILLMAAVVIAAVLPRFFGAARMPAQEGFIENFTQLLPLLGFAGTIWGITIALSALPSVFHDQSGQSAQSEILNEMLLGLATAFETTLLGVAAAIVISFLSALAPE